jgi:hypothetical protein
VTAPDGLREALAGWLTLEPWEFDPRTADDLAAEVLAYPPLAAVLAERDALRATVARVQALLYAGREGHIRQAELRRALDGDP